MILTHFVFFQFFAGATNTIPAANLALYSKIHQGPGFAF